MRHRRANLAVTFVAALAVVVSACGSGDADQIADLERQIDELENRIASTTSTSLEVVPSDNPVDEAELVAFGVCIDDAIQALSSRAQSDIGELHDEIRNLASSHQMVEDLAAQRLSEDQILFDEGKAGIVQGGADALKELADINSELQNSVDARYEKLYNYHSHEDEGDYIRVSGGVEAKVIHEAREEAEREPLRAMHASESATLAEIYETGVAKANAQTQVALSEVDLAFAVHQGDIDKLVIESRVATSASIDERTDRVEEIERSVDQAIEDLEVARQAASFGQLDWSACSSS